MLECCIVCWEPKLIGNNQSRSWEVYRRCFPNLEWCIVYWEHRFGNNQSRSWDICRWCFPNVGKLYSMCWHPISEIINPDLGTSVDGVFPTLESCTVYWERNLGSGTSVDGVFPMLECCIVCWEPKLIGNNQSRSWEVYRRCFPNLEWCIVYWEHRFGNNQSRSWDICRWCFPNVGKLYSVYWHPISEIINPDPWTPVDSAFLMLKNCITTSGIHIIF